MHFKYDTESGMTECYLDSDDKCYLCDLCEDCPLIQGIEINLVYPSADMLHVCDCPMFERM